MTIAEQTTPTTPAKDPVVDQLERLTEAVETLTDTVGELAEKLHEVERDIAYSLGER